ncbi:MAG TPA: EF-P lysine aminoacylase GenX [Gammaproteobacteria bacterium]|nr:EF-P lysine aminoacylase GenX [Gammaproteobacteria bacterium]
MPGTDPAGDNAWRPSATAEVLKLRATLLARIRTFFDQRAVLEVDTPALSRFGGTDPAIEPLCSTYRGPGHGDGLPLYLHSSPEFFMKRLLAAGSGPIYQLAHVFRNGELGRRHNPEFMLLEWYRPGLDDQALMDEVDALLAFVLQGRLSYRPARRISYRQWFLDGTGLDPWTDDTATFRRFAEQKLASVPATLDDSALDPWLDLLVTHWLEPALGEAPVFIHDYPASQAALARIRRDEVPVAERFELYIGGIELANGFHELSDAQQQRQRFEQENRVREGAGQATLPIDRHLLAALQSGLPDCSGVAIGFDRLVMVAAGLPDIAAAMPFPFNRA